MLMAHPAVMANVLEQYETLQALHAEEGDAEVRQRLDDVGYNLCIATGTGDVDAAVIAARHHLPGTGLRDDSLLGG